MLRIDWVIKLKVLARKVGGVWNLALREKSIVALLWYRQLVSFIEIKILLTQQNYYWTIYTQKNCWAFFFSHFLIKQILFVDPTKHCLGILLELNIYPNDIYIFFNKSLFKYGAIGILLKQILTQQKLIRLNTIFLIKYRSTNNFDVERAMFFIWCFSGLPRLYIEIQSNLSQNINGEKKKCFESSKISLWK